MRTTITISLIISLESDFTSIQQRISAWQKETMTEASAPKEAAADMQFGSSKDVAVPDTSNPVPDGVSTVGNPLDGVTSSTSWLCPIQSGSGRRGILPMTDAEYVDLVDRSGRLLRSDKRGSIDADLAPILVRIGARPDAWIETISCFGSRFRLAAGLLSSLRGFADQLGRHWFIGVGVARAVFAQAPPRLA